MRAELVNPPGSGLNPQYSANGSPDCPQTVFELFKIGQVARVRTKEPVTFTEKPSAWGGGAEPAKDQREAEAATMRGAETLNLNAGNCKPERK